MKLEDTLSSWKECYDRPRQSITKQRHHFANKGPSCQSYGFSSSHVLMWELYHKEGWAPKNWCFQIVVIKKTLEHPLDCKEIKPVNPKRNQSWIFTGSWSSNTLATWCEESTHWIRPDAGKDQRQKEKRAAEDERWLDGITDQGHELGWTLGDGVGQGGLVCYSPWSCKELDMT